MIDVCDCVHILHTLGSPQSSNLSVFLNTYGVPQRLWGIDPQVPLWKWIERSLNDGWVCGFHYIPWLTWIRLAPPEEVAHSLAAERAYTHHHRHVVFNIYCGRYEYVSHLLKRSPTALWPNGLIFIMIIKYICCYNKLYVNMALYIVPLLRIARVSDHHLSLWSSICSSPSSVRTYILLFYSYKTLRVY